MSIRYMHAPKLLLRKFDKKPKQPILTDCKPEELGLLSTD